MLVGVSRISFLLYHRLIFIIILCVIATRGQISFQDEPYTTTLDEESPIGTYLLTVIAGDLASDSNTGNFSIPSNEFVIGVLSGEVRTLSVIDRESPLTPLQFVFMVTYDSDKGEFLSKSIYLPHVSMLFRHREIAIEFKHSYSNCDLQWTLLVRTRGPSKFVCLIRNSY